MVSIGVAAAEAAASDPRCNGRQVVAVGHSRQFQEAVAEAGPGGSALVVVPAVDLTYDVVTLLVETSVASGTAIGIVPLADDGRLLGGRTTRAPAAANLGALYCDFQSSFKCDVDFGRQEVEGYLRRLVAGVEATVLHLHGNGADLQLGSHVFCVQVDHLRGAPGPTDLTLPCQAGGPCRLAHLRSIEAYWGASAMRARIVVLVSCWGYLPSDGILSPEVLFGTALLRGPTVEAFVASTRVTFNTPQVAQASLAFLEMGGTAGELCLLLNRLPATATPPYVCIGDPDVSVQVRDGGHVGRHPCSGASASSHSGQIRFERLSRIEELTRGSDLPPAVRDEIFAAFGPAIKGGQPKSLSRRTAEAVVKAVAGYVGESEPVAPVGPEPGDEDSPLLIRMQESSSILTVTPTGPPGMSVVTAVAVGGGVEPELRDLPFAIPLVDDGVTVVALDADEYRLEVHSSVLNDGDRSLVP